MTVELLLDLRSEYLRTPGCNVLKHWDQIADRLRAAARSSSGPEQWFTSMRRYLQLSGPSKSSSGSAFELCSVVAERGVAREWLTMLEDDWGLLMAKARLISEHRKDAKEASDGEAR